METPPKQNKVVFNCEQNLSSIEALTARKNIKAAAYLKAMPTEDIASFMDQVVVYGGESDDRYTHGHVYSPKEKQLYKWSSIDSYIGFVYTEYEYPDVNDPVYVFDSETNTYEVRYKVTREWDYEEECIRINSYMSACYRPEEEEWVTTTEWEDVYNIPLTPFYSTYSSPQPSDEDKFFIFLGKPDEGNLGAVYTVMSINGLYEWVDCSSSIIYVEYLPSEPGIQRNTILRDKLFYHKNEHKIYWLDYSSNRQGDWTWKELAGGDSTEGAKIEYVTCDGNDLENKNGNNSSSDDISAIFARGNMPVAKYSYYTNTTNCYYMGEARGVYFFSSPDNGGKVDILQSVGGGKWLATSHNTVDRLFKCIIANTKADEIINALNIQNRIPVVFKEEETLDGKIYKTYYFERSEIEDDIKVVYFRGPGGAVLKVKGSQWSVPNPVSKYEDTINKVTTINNESTDVQYPSAKAVYTIAEEYRSAIFIDFSTNLGKFSPKLYDPSTKEPGDKISKELADYLYNNAFRGSYYPQLKKNIIVRVHYYRADSYNSTFTEIPCVKATSILKNDDGTYTGRIVFANNTYYAVYDFAKGWLYFDFDGDLERKRSMDLKCSSVSFSGSTFNARIDASELGISESRLSNLLGRYVKFSLRLEPPGGWGYLGNISYGTTELARRYGLITPGLNGEIKSSVNVLAFPSSGEKILTNNFLVQFTNDQYATDIDASEKYGLPLPGSLSLINIGVELRNCVFTPCYTPEEKAASSTPEKYITPADLKCYIVVEIL